ncbi:hypothetical protein [Streptomyces sp. NPDC054787]
MEREGPDGPIPRSAVEEIALDGQDEAVPVRLGMWICNPKTSRDKLTQEQLDALRELA